MRRSEINQALQSALAALREHKIALPPFADWPPQSWSDLPQEHQRVKANGLGWDVIDLGQGNFAQLGGVLFTLRNGNHRCPELGTPYCEKLIVLQPGQRMPLHMHWSKTEDIINRAGGVLVMELYNAQADDTVDHESTVEVFCEGCRREVPPGGALSLQPGESITIHQRLYHRFWADKDAGVLVCGEVSTVNDDEHDNCFAEPAERFSPIEEDQPPLRLLCNEYPK